MALPPSINHIWHIVSGLWMDADGSRATPCKWAVGPDAYWKIRGVEMEPKLEEDSGSSAKERVDQGGSGVHPEEQGLFLPASSDDNIRLGSQESQGTQTGPTALLEAMRELRDGGVALPVTSSSDRGASVMLGELGGATAEAGSNERAGGATVKEETGNVKEDTGKAKADPRRSERLLGKPEADYSETPNVTKRKRQQKVDADDDSYVGPSTKKSKTRPSQTPSLDSSANEPVEEKSLSIGADGEAGEYDGRGRLIFLNDGTMKRFGELFQR